MTEQCVFQLKQIVWAKVPQHPWWPGRIVKQMKQNKRNIYRIHFFGDPSYCYLEENQLLDFQTGLSQIAQECSLDFKLRKPIQLAKVAWKKMQMLSNTQNMQEQTYIERTSCLPQEYQSGKMEIIPIIENAQLTLNSAQLQNNQKTQQLTIPKLLQVNQETVIDILTSQNFRKFKACKGYINRKQFAILNEKLKQTLLQKYSLDEFNMQFGKKRIVLPSMRKSFKNHLTQKRKTKPSLSKKLVFQHCLRKLNSSIQKHIPGKQGRELAMRMIEKTEQECGKGTQQYRRTFKSMMMWLNKNKSLEINNLQTFLYGMEQFKKEDEEKSKITQTDPIN